MVRFVFIRLLLALVTYLDLYLFQIYVKTAFLNRNLEEEIYMDQPVSFVSKDQEDKVCRLKGSIYDNLPDHGTLDSMKPLLHLA